jgi:hypothetical protein
MYNVDLHGRGVFVRIFLYLRVFVCFALRKEAHPGRIEHRSGI